MKSLKEINEIKLLREIFNKKTNKIILIISILIILTGSGGYLYNYTRPFNIYERAYSQTLKENKTYIKNTIITEGDIEELSSQTIEYAVNKNKKLIDIEKKNLDNDKASRLLIEDDKMYLKIEDGRYVTVTDSSYLNEFTNNMKIEGNNIYDEFQTQIRDSFDKKNITKEKINRVIGDKDYKLTELTLTVPKEKAKEIVSSYVKKDFDNNSKELVEETVLTQKQYLETTGKTLTEEELTKLKEEILSLLEKNLEDKLKGIDYSDITIKIGVDSSGYIRYREESYDMIIDEKTSTLRNITEYISFGNDVKMLNVKDLEIIDFETYVEEQKEKHKENVKTIILENPNENIDMDNIKQTIEDNNKKPENNEQDSEKKQKETIILN